MLRWGAAGGCGGRGSGARSAGKVREHGEVEGEAGLVQGAAEPLLLLFIIY